MSTLRRGARFLLGACAALFASSEASAFKIGYRGVPVIVGDFPAVHEATTAEAVRHVCMTRGVEEFQASRFFRSLLRSSLKTCNELSFDSKTTRWRDQISDSPIHDLILGVRFPDLREMTGIDANKQDAFIARFDAEVQLDAYRLYPQFHGQLSKFHNIWGGDMELGMNSLRSFARATFYEVAALALTHDPESAPRNDFVAANAILDHDANRTTNDLVYDVRWHAVLLGILAHSIQDIFSHDPLLVLDTANNRLIHQNLFYGRFRDPNDAIVDATTLYPRIHQDMAASMKDLGNMATIVRHSPTGPLEVSRIPETVQVDGKMRTNFFEHEGKRYQAGQLATTLSMYALAELLEAIAFAVDHPEQPAQIEARLVQFLEKYYASDFHPLGLTPTRAQDIAEVVPDYARLPWYDYHFVDLWKQSNLPDRVTLGKQAFALPWSDRASMGDVLQKPDVDAHFVVLPGNVDRYDEATRIWHLDRKRLYVFESWFRGGPDFAQSVELTSDQFYSLGENGSVSVRELELEIDSEDIPGLDQVYASAWIPAGYRACFHSETDPSVTRREPARTAVFDRAHELYRCFYGTQEGRWAHIEFHLRQGTRLFVLPIDADGDFVPFLRGVLDEVASDNCPFHANLEQSDLDDDGLGDACDNCPNEAGSPALDGCNASGSAGFGGGGASGVAGHGGLSSGVGDSNAQASGDGGMPASRPTDEWDPANAGANGSAASAIDESGCTCGIVGRNEGPPAVLLVALLAMLPLRRRRATRL